MRRAAVVLALLAASPALAYHDEKPVRAYSSATLQDGELQLGPFGVGYGLGKRLEFDTLPLMWLLKTPNLEMKWNFAGDPLADGWSWAARTGLFTMRPHDFDADIDKDVRINAIPLFGTVTYKAGDWRYNLTLGYTYVGVTGQQDGDTTTVDGVAAASTSTLSPAIEWRLGRVLALVLEGNVMLFQQLQDETSTTVQLEPSTKLTLYQTGNAELATGFVGNAVLAAVWSWNTFHLRLGLGYGNYALPVVDIFLPDRFAFPDVDLYWRF